MALLWPPGKWLIWLLSSMPKMGMQSSMWICVSLLFFSDLPAFREENLLRCPLSCAKLGCAVLSGWRPVVAHCTSKWADKLNLSQFSSVAQLCPTLCDPMNRSKPGLPVHHHLPMFTQTHVHQVGDAIQPSQSLSSPSPPAPNPSQYQSLFQWVNSSHEVAKVLEFQL